ncbi:MAG: pilus assembly protein TadG-related protein [Candidatus Binatia bacterium]
MRKLNQRGSFLVFLTLGFALLGTFIGFAVDFGRAYLEKARVSRLIDGAALAAAKVLKGQVAFEPAATRAACDSMLMNGAQVAWTGGNTCSTTSGAPITATISFFDLPVPGGPPLRAVRILGSEPVPTTFLRFLGWMAPGDYSTINVVAQAEAGPERPIDLMLVLDRSGSMTAPGGDGPKINSLKTAVNGFLGLSNLFSANDRIGMTSFAYRGCGSAGTDSTSTAVPCPPDAVLDFATSSYISTLQSKVNALVASGGTNTMEALRTARPPLAAAFTDPTRATTRKAVLLVTDGQPTWMRRDSATECQQNVKTGTTLPSPGNTGGQTGGCLFGVNTWDSGNTRDWMVRASLSSPTTQTRVPNPAAGSVGAALYRDTIRCTRALIGCITRGAMYEADQIRNCGYGNSACGAAGAHDIVFFAIAIGRLEPTNPQGSLDDNAKCMLARMANATDIVTLSTGVVETMTTVCSSPTPTTTLDTDTHADLVQQWPCGTGPCIDTTQEKGKVFIVDQGGNVTQQLTAVFNEIAAILKLRLVL